MSTVSIPKVFKEMSYLDQETLLRKLFKMHKPTQARIARIFNGMSPEDRDIVRRGIECLR